MTMTKTKGKYAVGTKVWLAKNSDLYHQRVTITDNAVMRGNTYHGYTVRAYSERYGEHYTIGMVAESDLTYRKVIPA